MIVYDHRGVGREQRARGRDHDRARWREDAAGLLAALGIDSAHVLGISMGGMIAQELALAHPELVRTLDARLHATAAARAARWLRLRSLARASEAMLSGDRERALRAGWEVNVSPSCARRHGAHTRGSWRSRRNTRWRSR